MSTAQLKNRFAEAKDTTVQNLHEARDKVVKVSKDTVTKIDREAHKKPWHFMAGTALFTVVLGFFFGRKTKR